MWINDYLYTIDLIDINQKLTNRKKGKQNASDCDLSKQHKLCVRLTSKCVKLNIKQYDKIKSTKNAEIKKMEGEK